MKCPRCAGNKRIMGLGFVEVDCPVCKGIGSLPDSAKFEVTTVASSPDPVVIPKATKPKSQTKRAGA